MPRDSDILGQLLQTGDTLFEQARAFQAGRPSKKPRFSQSEVNDFQEAFSTWRATCIDNLKGNYRDQFRRESSDPKKCMKFVVDPLATQQMPVTFAKLVSGGNHSNGLTWRYPFDRTFETPYKNLRILLVDAKTDFARDGVLSGSLPSSLNLHPRIINACSKLYEDTHYPEAVFKGCGELCSAVREKSGYTEITNARQNSEMAMMNAVFSPDKPILIASDLREVREGYFNLFKGAIGVFRNPLAHPKSDNEEINAESALDALCFLSLLLTAVDNTRLSTTCGRQIDSGAS